MRPDKHQPIVCVVCDRLFTKSHDHETYSAKGIPLVTLSNMLKFLTVPESMDPLLRLQYDVSQCSVFGSHSDSSINSDIDEPTRDCLEKLHTLLLSPRGVMRDGSLIFCRECLTPLQLKKCQKPPKFAIANGNAIGHLPAELSDLTLAENLLIAQVQTSAIYAKHNPVIYN
jgi:hypothetical protein